MNEKKRSNESKLVINLEIEEGAEFEEPGDGLGDEIVLGGSRITQGDRDIIVL
jgi:hypothetical protein